MNEIRYETPIESVDFNLDTIFLAGPTVRGNQPHLTSWRFEAIRLFAEKKFNGNLIIPEFVDTRESDKHRNDIPLWELSGLEKSHMIMFWIPRTMELIGLTTNYEFGYWTARDRNKIVYGRPDNAYRIKYLDIMWLAERRSWNELRPIYKTLADTVDAVLV